MVEKAHTAPAEPAGWWPQVYGPLRQMGSKIADFFAPSADAAATAEFYEINVELPGVAAEDIDIAVHDNTLTIKGEKRAEKQESGRTYFFSEREFGAFIRTFRLPNDSAPDDIAAEFGDGVLRIRIAKTAPTEQTGRRVPVRKL